MFATAIIMTLIVGIFSGAVGLWTVAHLMDRKAQTGRHRTITFDETAQSVEDLCRVETPLAPTFLV